VNEFDAPNEDEDEEDHSNALQSELWLQLWAYARRYPRDLAFIGVFAIVTAAMEISYPLITRSVVDAVAANTDSSVLWKYALWYALTTVVISIAIGGFIRVGGKLQNRISYDIRQDGFANLQALSYSYFNHRPVGWLMARMTADCDRLSNIVVWGFLDAVWGFTMMIGIIIAMYWLHPLLATVVLCVMPVLALVSVYFQRRLLTSARAATVINSRITANYNESISGVLTSKVFVREEANKKDFNNLTRRLANAKIKNVTYASIYLPIVVTLASLAIGLTLVLGGIEVLGGVITVGTLVAFLGFANNIFEPVEEISERFAEMQMAQASAERILGLINEKPAIQDTENLCVSNADTTLISRIQLVDVCFAYDSSTAEKSSTKNLSSEHSCSKPAQPVLKNINLDASYGQTIAIVGPTGGGKSTLVNVLARFYEPTQGAVLINGVEYRHYSQHWLQSRLGVVLQDNHIFSGTIMSNIRYGQLDATEEQIVDASKLAGAHEFIMAFEDTYNTQAGEGGNRLSAGQKQLVSLARAVVANPQILIMDEATSSVDTETEQRIQQGMASLLKGRMGFIIAHRLSTIRQADHILFVDEGRIVEQGSHRELMIERGRYRALYELQQLQDSTERLFF